MVRYLAILLSVLAGATSAVRAQVSASAKPYQIVIKGGHVIDPKNGINAVMDIAIAPALDMQPLAWGQALSPDQEGRIAMIAENIDPGLAVQVVDAKGLYVVPGLVDIHSHNFWGHDGERQMNGPRGLPPDGFTFRSGVTTVVDAGGSGWRTFPLFREQTIERSQTRVLAMLNIVGEGMRGSRYEQNITDMDPDSTAKVARTHDDLIVGIKLAHFSGHDWTPTDRALAAGRLADIPIMVDFGSAKPYLPLETLFLEKFRPGDIYTHCFGGNSSTSPDGRESIVDVTTNKVKLYVLEAQKRGVVFDVGFGGASFLFAQGTPAIAGGFYPNSISTDIHVESMNNAMKDMPNIMSLFMAMGMPLEAVIAASTWHPAQEINRSELGNLSVGAVADIALFRLVEGDFGFWARDGKIAGRQRLFTEMTLRGGHIVYNLNGRVDPINAKYISN
ncbi:amidohydrolase/deacetylase family metallohydrolase [Parapedobacter lycopersici]|uniref:amidohydrolase/deacetylase family metallohydrolase n=1 Tax=Parapedobacter lycopersici TaxID=1864939 RepID=UPI003340EEF6